jgi:DNA recombination protein RmuC
LNALEADNEDDRRKYMAEHARQIRDHMDNLGSKNYWDQFSSAPDFVVMFLPGEIFFSAALEADAAQRRDQGLIEYGMGKRVILASPTTLIAILKGVSYGWQQEKIAESAQEISDLGKELFERLCIFAEFLKKLGGSLGTAVDHYNDAIGSLEKRLLVTAREFPKLGVTGKRELPEVPPVTKAVQQLQAPEMVEHISIKLPAPEQVRLLDVNSLGP